jgi:hypothetical protein
MPGAPWGWNQYIATPEVRSAAKRGKSVPVSSVCASVVGVRSPSSPPGGGGPHQGGDILHGFVFAAGDVGGMVEPAGQAGQQATEAEPGLFDRPRGVWFGQLRIDLIDRWAPVVDSTDLGEGNRSRQ